MRAREAAAGLAVVAALGIVWQAALRSQQAGSWRVVDLDPAPAHTPDVAIDGAGNAVAVWTGQQRTRAAVFTSATGVWSPAVTLSNGDDPSANPRVGSNLAGDAVAVWRAVRSSSAVAYIAVSRYSSATGTWSNVLELPTQGYLPRALIDGHGNIVVVWAEFLRDEGFYYGWVHEMRSVQYDATTASWSAPQTLSGDYAWELDAVIDGAGTVTVVWGREQAVESTRWSPATSSWSPVTAIYSTRIYSLPTEYSPRLAVDPGGNVVAVFKDDYTGVLFATRFSAAAQAWRAPTLVASDGSANAPVSLAVDAVGNALLAYDVAPDVPAGTLRSRIYLAATDTWSGSTDIATGVAPGGARVAVDPRGNATVVWRTTTDSLRIAHRPIGGAWTTDAARESTVEPPRVASDGAGTIHVLWSSSAAPQAIRAARLSRLAAPAIRRVTSTSATLAIDFTPVADASSYEYSVDDGASWTGRTPASIQAVLVIGGLIDGVAYPLRVRAIGAAGAGPPSDVSLATPGLAAPANLRVAAQVGTAVTFAWTPAASGIAPAGYVLEGGPGPGSELARLPSDGTGTLLTVPVPVGVFHARVRGVLGNAESEPSPDIRINVGVPEPPSSPMGLLGLVDGSAVTLAWQNTFGGGQATGIVIEVAGTVAAAIPLPLTDRFAVAGVSPGTYTVSVRAVNPSGSSGASNAVTLTLPGLCSPPQMPATFSAARTGRTIVVAWSPPAAGAAPSHYVLSVSGSIQGSFPTTGLTLAGTVAPGTYVMSVAAVNACGTSAATPSRTITIP